MNRSRTAVAAASGVILLGILGGFFAGKALAGGIPPTAALTYSGKLEGAGGEPLPSPQTLQLRFWNDPSASAASNLLCESGSAGTTVTLSSGHFSIKLPDTCTAAINTNANAYVELRVGDPLVSLGRTKIGAVPYAVEASHAVSSDKANLAARATAADTANAASGPLATRIGTLETAAHVYMYEGALATATEWEADLIFNKRYGRFCQAIGKTYVSHQELVNHYHPGRENGYFYAGWYYVGPRYCADDTLFATTESPSTPTGSYSVWKYSGNCGCCIASNNGNWTIEARALITCK
jgi:hypothetical protein